MRDLAKSREEGRRASAHRSDRQRRVRDPGRSLPLLRRLDGLHGRGAFPRPGWTKAAPLWPPIVVVLPLNGGAASWRWPHPQKSGGHVVICHLPAAIRVVGVAPVPSGLALKPCPLGPLWSRSANIRRAASSFQASAPRRRRRSLSSISLPHPSVPPPSRGASLSAASRDRPCGSSVQLGPCATTPVVRGLDRPRPSD